MRPCIWWERLKCEVFCEQESLFEKLFRDYPLASKGHLLRKGSLKWPKICCADFARLEEIVHGKYAFDILFFQREFFYLWWRPPWPRTILVDVEPFLTKPRLHSRIWGGPESIITHQICWKVIIFTSGPKLPSFAQLNTALIPWSVWRSSANLSMKLTNFDKTKFIRSCWNLRHFDHLISNCWKAVKKVL